MTTPLSPVTVDQALASLEIVGINRQDRRWTATFGPWVGCPAFRLVIEAPLHGSVLELRALPSVAFGREDHAELVAACNAWHEDYRWPRLCVVERDGSLMIEADLQVPCDGEMTVDQVATVIASFVSGVRDFWEHMTTRSGRAIDGVLQGLAELLDRAAARRGDLPGPQVG